MNILIWGNQNNIGYRLAKMFRKYGHNCVLYINKYSSTERSLPELMKPDLKDNYPDWIKVNNNLLTLRYFLPLDLIRDAKKYDVVITTGPNILSSWWFSDFLKMPVVFQPLGFDLREAPFFKTPWHSWYDRIIMKHSIKNMAGLLIRQLDSLQAAKKLNYDRYIKWVTLPQDIKELKENISQDIEETFLDYEEYDTVFYMPSRMNLDETKVSYKGNDKVLKAYIKLKQNTDKRIKIVFGKHGLDVNKFIKMAKGINDGSIEFIDHIPAFKMHKIFTLPNIIILDQFNRYPDMGGVCREALSLGAIVISKPLNNSYHDVFYSNPPIIEAYSTVDIYNAMKKVVDLDIKQKINLSRRSEKWAWENLDIHIWIERYLKYVNEIIELHKKGKDNGN